MTKAKRKWLIYNLVTYAVVIAAILAYEVGAKPSAEAFCTWFDSLLPASEK